PDGWLEAIEEIGSGLHYQRTRFTQLLEHLALGQVRRLISAHHDRLVRLGVEWFAAFCARHGTELLLVNGDALSPEHALGQDLLSLVPVFQRPAVLAAFLPAGTQEGAPRCCCAPRSASR